jgi:hypothetical protein
MQHLTYIPITLLQNYDNGYLVKVIETLINAEEMKKIGLADLKDKYEKVMGYPLRDCFMFPDNIEEFLKRKKVIFSFDGNMISFAPKVDENVEMNTNVFNKREEEIIIIDDDDEVESTKV